jgi:hypothetical protein
MGDQPTQTQAASQNAKLARLAPLVGTWRLRMTTSRLVDIVEDGSAVCAWMEGGAFLGLRQQLANQPEFPMGLSVIGADDASELYTMIYADPRGVARVHQMSFDGHVWRFWRDAPGFSQRFAGTLSEDGATITGCWELSTDGTTWEIDFEGTYTRIG